MLLNIRQIKKIVVEPGHISAKDFDKLEAEAKRKEQEIVDLIIDKGLITDSQMGQLIAQEFKFPFVDLRNEKIVLEDFMKVPEDIARAKKAIIFGRAGNLFKLGMVNPGDIKTIQLFRKFLGENIKAYLITKRDFKVVMLKYKRSLEDEMADITNKYHEKLATGENHDKLIVEMLDVLLVDAYNKKASDIHIEPTSLDVVVRFRVDGVMHTVLKIEKEFLPHLLQRVKILAGMKIDEHLKAQDGKLKFNLDEEKVDVRVSIVPVSDGENVVLRILSSKNRQMSLDGLGFSHQKLKQIENVLKNPHGMVLVVGPTGSGKTTTLYEIIKKLNNDSVHISSIEDPVEYNMEGVSQIQVNPSINLNFVAGLRALMRQDPDIIMVGEIRDSETAKIAVGAAMTGHLVLSTEHSNNSATALLRLLELGVEPFMTASTVKMIIAQRLVRTICSKCRYSYKLSDEEKALIELRPELKRLMEKIFNKDLDKITLYKGSGCNICSNTGYSGRIGIYEILEVSSEIKKAVISESSDDAIMEIARKNGMEVMLEDGLRKIMTGDSTLEEILRVTIK